jgi:glycogen debranching enzyme
LQATASTRPPHDRARGDQEISTHFPSAGPLLKISRTHSSQHATPSQSSPRETRRLPSPHEIHSQSSPHPARSQSHRNAKRSQSSRRETRSQSSAHPARSQSHRNAKRSLSSPRETRSQSPAHPARSQSHRNAKRSLSSRAQRGICFFPRSTLFLSILFLICTFFSPAASHAQQSPTTSPKQDASPPALELSRAIRPWEFLSAVGTQAGLFGNESGNIEAWVYPLKILRDFHLRIHTDSRILDASTLARTITAHPESVTVLYTGDTFNIRETFFVPVNEPGALITLQIETEHPLEIEVLFQRDFQLEWPAALGGTYAFYDAPRQAFYFGEETKKFVALVGSPTASEIQLEYATDYSASDQNGFFLGATQKGRDTRKIVIAASVNGPAEAEKTYRHLLADSDALLKTSADYYRDYLARTISLDLPDKQIQQAYDWSRISELQGVVKNPYLGTGIVAGYRTSGSSQRPGFAWFFGRDSMWTSLAFDAVGDFASTRLALDFLSKVQRADGKIPHEIAQGASLVPWFTDYPYAFASADATPLYIIAMDDYVTTSGDISFAKEKWPSLQKAYAFLQSTYDANGLPQNFGIGHGWVEGGPLLPVKTELYQSALGLEATHAMEHLSSAMGSPPKDHVTFSKDKSFLNNAFWIPESKHYAFALDMGDKKIDQPSVLSTVPMWFGLLDDDKANAMIDELAKPTHQTDWGMRIISNENSKYSAGGYHFGAVWPLFTGWASVAEYKYHRPDPAYSNLRANALLALDGSLGHTTEVLSGDYYSSLSTSSPHQIWSAAMVVNPILRGMLGLETDAAAQRITLTPHLPANWRSFSIKSIAAGKCLMDALYLRTPNALTLSVQRRDTESSPTCALVFVPATSPRTHVKSVQFDGRPLSFRLVSDSDHQHIEIGAPLHSGTNVLRIVLSDDFSVSYDSSVPNLGSASRNLHVLSQAWSADRNQLILQLSSLANAEYFLSPSDVSQIAAIEGADLLSDGPRTGQIRVRIRNGTPGSFISSSVTIHLTPIARAATHSKP